MSSLDYLTSGLSNWRVSGRQLHGNLVVFASFVYDVEGFNSCLIQLVDALHPNVCCWLSAASFEYGMGCSIPETRGSESESCFHQQQSVTWSVLGRRPLASMATDSMNVPVSESGTFDNFRETLPSEPPSPSANLTFLESLRPSSGQGIWLEDPPYDGMSAAQTRAAQAKMGEEQLETQRKMTD